MDSTLDLKLVVKHLANGTICENLCRVCLKPLTEDCENIFTKICKEDKEYCIADVLKELCRIQISDTDHYSVCRECFVAASNAYKFFLNTKCNDELLNYYVDELENYLQTVNMSDDTLSGESICISLPAVSIERATFDYDIENFNNVKENQFNMSIIKEEIGIKSNVSVKCELPNKGVKKEIDDSEILIVTDEKGHSTFYKMLPDGVLEKVEYNLKRKRTVPDVINIKKRKKREPMTSKKCSWCPIKYRFIAKLQEHMRMEHGVILYSCKICQALTEDVEFHNFHIKTHTNVYECDICSVTFKKRDVIINHMKVHEAIGNAPSNIMDYVCVHCGMILEDKEALGDHVNLHHYKKFACFYCGRIYKVKESFDKHVQKHELYMKTYKERLKHQEKRTFTNAEAKKLIAECEAQEQSVSKDFTCELCGRSFRSARALLWHSRLHTNERPFKCDTCGRGFVSLNRRNQHALCAHTPPARRCPLCPARFHLRSMVNTHVKKVHLKAHKRRARTAAAPAGLAAPVPVQELSVALQPHVLELQARDHDAHTGQAVVVEVPPYLLWNSTLKIDQ